MRKIRWFLIGSVTALAFLGIGYFWLHQSLEDLGDVYKFPVETKIIDCNEQEEHAAFTMPDGKYTNLLIGFSGPMRDLPGHLELAVGKRIVQSIDFSSTSTQPCNWLSGHGVQGRILERGSSLLDDIASGQRVHVRVKFDRIPPEGVSLWLSTLYPLDSTTPEDPDPQKIFSRDTAALDLGSITRE